MRIVYPVVLTLSVVVVLGTRPANTADAPAQPGANHEDTAELEEAARKLGIHIRHRRVILLRLKQDAGEEAGEAIEVAIKELPSKVDAIRTLEWGRIDRPQDANQGFTHCVLLSFDDAQARDILARHEAYQEFQQQLRPHIDDLIVVDYRPESRFWRPSRAISPQNDID
jgi:hypothetical protein